MVEFTELVLRRMQEPERKLELYPVVSRSRQFTAPAAAKKRAAPTPQHYFLDFSAHDFLWYAYSTVVNQDFLLQFLSSQNICANFAEMQHTAWLSVWI